LPTLPKLFDAIQKGIVQQLDVRSKKMFSWECRQIFERKYKRWKNWQSYR